MLSILPDLYNFDNCIGRPPFLALCKRCETSRRAGHTAMHATCLPCLGRRKDVGANQSRAISGSGAFPVAESVEAPGAIPMAKPFKWTYQEDPVVAEMPGCFGPRVLIFKKLIFSAIGGQGRLCYTQIKVSSSSVGPLLAGTTDPAPRESPHLLPAGE